MGDTAAGGPPRLQIDRIGAQLYWTQLDRAFSIRQAIEQMEKAGHVVVDVIPITSDGKVRAAILRVDPLSFQ